MVNKNYYDKINQNINKCNNIIKYRYLYNFKSIITIILLKSEIALDYIYPYVIASLITLNLSIFKENKPFIKDNIITKASIERLYQKNSSEILYNYGDKVKYDYTTIVFDGAWNLNQDQTYSRQIVSFKCNNQLINNLNINEIINMNYNDLCNLFEIEDSKTITKNIKDNKHDLENIYVSIHENNYISKNETENENNYNSFIFVILVLLEGIGISKINNIIIRKKIRTKLQEFETQPIIYTKQDIERLKMIITVQKANLEYIQTDNRNNKPKIKIK